MTWIVIEGDPKPETCVVILVRPRIEAVELFNIRKQFSVFDKASDAISYATKLKNQYCAESVTMVYPDGHSLQVS